MAKFTETIKLTISTRSSARIAPHNRIDIHPHTALQQGLMENERVTITHKASGKSRTCTIMMNGRISESELAITRSSFNLFQAEAGEELEVSKIKSFLFTKVRKQTVQQIKYHNVEVSKDIFQQLNQKVEQHVLVNHITGDVMPIPTGKFVVNPSIENDTIKLNYKQREFLQLENPPDMINRYYFDAFLAKGVWNEEQEQFFKENYIGEKEVNSLNYTEKVQMNRMLKQVGFPSIGLYPDYDTVTKKPSIWRRFIAKCLETVIGQTSTSFKVIRPYSSDEASNAVRLTPSAMNLLGIEETDNIVIEANGKAIKARVLALESKELLKETNIITSEGAVNLVIGIPVHLRSELGIPDIHHVVEVKRDVWYLFRKNYNIQFIPVLATILAAFALNEFSIVTRFGLCVLLIPISIFVTFSQVRNQISNS
ncbi:hypothetical protein KO561_15900 [Radiobacillus kanasensis]|uniref:hypothetical protein n=1 Tax=Radiobacillus kanasensis TaxID=2844358 RepID=UPI001E3CF594|nr:hypothetical protein [Radiobacillus kanasensis]UFT98663.1 hypothetical protein KO561_15900 [Radiobacillus kanasensis]